MDVCMITPDSLMIDRRILLEARTLVKAGHNVTLLGGFECKKEEFYVDEGVKVYRSVYDWDDNRLKKIRNKLPNNDKMKMMVNQLFMKFIQKLLPINSFENYMLNKLMSIEKMDVIHVHDLPCLKVGYHCAKKRKIPLIFDAHEIYYSQETLNPRYRKKLYRQEKKYIKHCEAVITVNQFIAELMAKRDHINLPYVIKNCTELPTNIDKLRKMDLIRNKYHLGKGSKILLYQGWISPERNIESLVRSVKYFNTNIYLVLIGYGDYKKVLEAICKEEKTEDKIIFVGEVPNEEILSYTVGADLGVIPYEPIDENHLYCSPNKLFEFVAGELPFICNKLPFFQYISEKYGVLLNTDMKNPKEIGKIVNQLLGENSNQLLTLKKNCSKAKEILNWEYESHTLKEIYQRLV